MTSATLEAPAVLPQDPIAEAIAGAEELVGPQPGAMDDQPVKTKELVIVNWSGDLDKVWPVLILSSTAAASGVRCRVFVTFWGLLPPSHFNICFSPAYDDRRPRELNRK